MVAWSRSILTLTLASLWIGCGAPLPVASTQAALSSCNLDGDCPTPAGVGRCVRVRCNTDHTCAFVNNGCSGGCGSNADCSVGTSACFTPVCAGSGNCNFTLSAGGGTPCACDVDGDCPMANTCQNAGRCIVGSCTY